MYESLEKYLQCHFEYILNVFVGVEPCMNVWLFDYWHIMQFSYVIIDQSWYMVSCYFGSSCIVNFITVKLLFLTYEMSSIEVHGYQMSRMTFQK